MKRHGTLLTVSIAIFVTWGVVLALSGGLGAGFVAGVMGKRFIFMSGRTDSALFGSAVTQLYAADPALRQTVAIYMTMLSATLSAVGIAVASLAWFALRAGSRGALAGLVLTPIPIVGWFLVVRSAYRAAGVDVTLGDTPPFVWVSAVVGLVGGALGWMGLRLTSSRDG